MKSIVSISHNIENCGIIAKFIKFSTSAFRRVLPSLVESLFIEMEAFSFLIQASEDGFVADLKYNDGKEFDSLKSPVVEHDIIDAILQLKDDTVVDKPSHFTATPSVQLQQANYHVERRPRAMSEPNVHNTKRTTYANHHTAPVTRFQPKPNSSLTSSLPATVPTFEEYTAICNKNGRIGIYTKEERLVLIARYRAKRNRRVWKKKIRYECRKDLADKRCRVKGRFVKRGNNNDDINSQEGSDENNSDVSGTHDDLQDLKVNASDGSGCDRLSYLASILGELDEDNDEEEEKSNQQPRKRMRRHSIAY